MFIKTKPAKSTDTKKNASIPSIITRDINILGNIVSDSVLDFDGTIEGNIRCHMFTLRSQGVVKGEVVADSVFVYGKINGLIRAKQVTLFASCHITGVIMHESLAIEDGAFIDAKFKRTDKPATADPYIAEDTDEEAASGMKMLENIRLISG